MPETRRAASGFRRPGVAYFADAVVSIFVHNPLLFLAIAAALEIAGLLFRGTRSRVPRLVHIAAAAWIAAGLWELYIMTFQPEANIRVDLLLFLFVLAVLSAWAAILLVLRSTRSA